MKHITTLCLIVCLNVVNAAADTTQDEILRLNRTIMKQQTKIELLSRSITGDTQILVDHVDQQQHYIDFLESELLKVKTPGTPVVEPEPDPVDNNVTGMPFDGWIYDPEIFGWVFMNKDTYPYMFVAEKQIECEPVESNDPNKPQDVPGIKGWVYCKQQQDVMTFYVFDSDQWMIVSK